MRTVALLRPACANGVWHKSRLSRFEHTEVAPGIFMLHTIGGVGPAGWR